MSSNETFIVSARKYRPTSFDDLLGQKAVAETLMHEIKNNKLAQAFLFTGPRGVGKTTAARILAKLINTEDGTSEDTDFSFNIFELDAASKGGVDDMRELIAQVRIPPARGNYKVYIIDEVHMLSTAAFNAFLKTLEEPPSYAIFILATTEKHKVLPTILSRCQVFNFNRIEIPDIVKQLRIIAEKEGIPYNEKALFLIAQKADGGMRDALSLFDQLVSFSNGEITYVKALELLNILEYEVFFDVITCSLVGDSASALILLDSIIKRGFDSSVFLGGLAAHVRNLIVCKNSRTASLIDVSEDIQAKYMQQAQEVEMGLLLNILDLVNTADENYVRSNHPRLMVELLLLKITNLNNLLKSVDEILQLKKKVVEDNETFSKSKFKTGAIEKPIDLKSLESTRLTGIEVTKAETETATIEKVEESSKEIATAVNEVITDTTEDTNSEIKLEQGTTELPITDVQGEKTEIPVEISKDQGEEETAEEIQNTSEINDSNIEIAEITVPDETAKDPQITKLENTELTKVLTDSADSTEPLEIKESSTKLENLHELWAAFISTLKGKEKTKMELTEIEQQDDILVATISTGVPLNSFDKTCIDFARYVEENQIQGIKKLQFKKGVIEVKNSSPYTENEKKDFLRNKHPLLAKLMDNNDIY